MKNRSWRRLLLTTIVLAVLGLFASSPVHVQTPPPELGQGWLPEFTLTSRHLLQLAEATPAEKYGWRPAPGVRSIGEVYMHLALGNYWLLERTGVKTGQDLSKLPKDPEKTITDKKEVMQWLRNSLDAVSTGYKNADRQKKVQLFNQETTAEQVFLRILVHNNEHMGQSIAYARMNGIAPPWSGQ